ncbi:MAG: YcxB family protein [Bacteroidota bacterium]
MGYKLSNYGFYEYSLGLMGLAYALFFFGSFTKWLIKRQADKVLNGGKNINLIGHRTINFNDSKVYFKTDTENSEIEWKAFEKLCETEQYLFLFASVNQALIVPKKHLSDIEVKELKELIRQKL